MPKFYIKENDTSPSIQAVLKDGEGNVENLTGFSVFFGLASGGNRKFNAAATIVDGPSGTVRYDWAAGDTDTPGNYLGEFKVTNLAGDVTSYPNSKEKQIEVIIEPEIA